MNERVLVVENNDGVREMLTYRLSPTYRVETARDGRAAWERLRGGDVPDLVLLDIKMPRMDGFTLLERLREDLDADVPVIVVSSTGRTRDLRRALALDVADYFVKPFETGDLLASVHRAVDADTDPESRGRSAG